LQDVVGIAVVSDIDVVVVVVDDDVSSVIDGSYVIDVSSVIDGSYVIDVSYVVVESVDSVAIGKYL